MSYKLGLDIGSTTLKAVVLDDQNNTVYRSYQRHRSKVNELTVEKLKELAPLLEGKRIKVAITGSAGLGLATRCGIEFVQEVFATASGVKKLYPQVDVVIELGGEDAKILFLKGAIEERMNSTCAGGTGVFIDQMASLLNVTLEELDNLYFQHENIYPIASRCGVFAKTDIQSLMNQGANKKDIAASIYQATVSQTISGLAQGRPIEGNVLFLGGPLSFLKGLQIQFQKTLKLDDKSAIFPEYAQHFVALSCAHYAAGTDKVYSYETLLNTVSNLAHLVEKPHGLPPLFESPRAYEEFLARHQKASVPEADAAGYSGPAYLGIDAGSTTTKIVLMDQDNRILYSRYCPNQGTPLAIVKESLEEIFALCGERIFIRQSAVTGYGEELIKNAFSVDIGIVETIAHYTAASYFNPQVDFIIDIGGQDIKCFQIKDGAINNVMLNEACSSGCGSFLETFANSLGYSIEDFVKLSLFAQNPVDLGTRCTVFMNSSVKQAQKNGASVEDISAGLAISVVKNAIYKVIRAKSTEDLGQNIVVQGGTFLNDAVLKSFEDFMGKQVVRPNISGLMGAYGAALYAKKNGSASSTLIGPKELSQFSHTSKVVNCGLCNNRCTLTVNTFANGGRFISGNRCERPVKGAKAQPAPNLYEFKLNYLTSLEPGTGLRGRIGLPFALNMYENLPFWNTLFSQLGFTTVISDVSSRKLHASGQHTIPSDTVCYPAKLTHGHIMNLVEKGVDAIFYPCMTYNFDEKMSDNHYNCPVVAYYPEVIEANVTLPDSVTFLYPYLDLNNRSLLPEKLQESLFTIAPYLTLQEIESACQKAYAAYDQYRSCVQEEGRRALEYARAHQLKTLILAGRPYHVDPEINHGIDKLISSFGIVILSEDALPPADQKPNLHVLNQWTYHARMYRAAQFAVSQPDTQLIQLVSFGCGIDAVTTDEMSDILRENGKLYTQIKIDEINNLGAVKIRIRSLLAAMDERRNEQ